MAENSTSPTTQKSKKSSKNKVIVAADGDIYPSDDYLRKQVESTIFIYSHLYPDSRILYIFLKHDGFEGQRNAVSLVPFEPVAPFIVKDKLSPSSTLEQRMTDHYGGDLLWYTVVGGKPEKNPRLVITVRVPKDAKGLPITNRTSLELPKKIAMVANNSPLLFETAKYQVEKRGRDRRENVHMHSPIPRETADRPNDLTKMDRTQRPSIIIGLFWLETGGAEKLGFDSIQWALDAGLRVFVISHESAPQRLASKLPDHPDVNFVRLDAYLPPNWQFNFLAALIRRENVCALHLHHHVQLYELLLKIKALFPHLTVIDSTHIIEHRDGGFPRISGVWTNFIDIHHVISNELVTYYRDVFGVSEKVQLGRMLEPHDWSQPLELKEPSLKAGQKTCRIVFVGRMVHQKRATLVVEIARQLNKWARKNSIELHVDMVGTGAYRGLVTKMISRAKLGRVITLHDADADVPALMEQADILLAPSSNEGLALVCYEAIENGAIPISTDVGGQRELVPASLLVRTPVKQCISDTVSRVERLMTDADFLEQCKSDIKFSYQELRRDPTAKAVLTDIYSDILASASEPAKQTGKPKT